MPQAHLVRRGAVYYWRRRLPRSCRTPGDVALSRDLSISLSLRTRERPVAARRAADRDVFLRYVYFLAEKP